MINNVIVAIKKNHENFRSMNYYKNNNKNIFICLNNINKLLLQIINTD